MSSHLIAWTTALGAVAGLIYGWHRTKAPYQRARAALDDSIVIGPERRRVIALQEGYRLGGTTIGAITGAGGGLVFGLLITALARFLGWPGGKR
jgi:hypothetical protein